MGFFGVCLGTESHKLNMFHSGHIISHRKMGTDSSKRLVVGLSERMYSNGGKISGSSSISVKIRSSFGKECLCLGGGSVEGLMILAVYVDAFRASRDD